MAGTSLPLLELEQLFHRIPLKIYHQYSLRLHFIFSGYFYYILHGDRTPSIMSVLLGTQLEAPDLQFNIEGVLHATYSELFQWSKWKQG